MARLIDADALIEEIGKEIDEAKKAPLCDYCAGMKTVIRIVKNQDTVDPVKHGHWIPFWSISNGDCFVCSECKGELFLADTWKICFKSPADKYKYCPNCGAKMDGDDKC